MTDQPVPPDPNRRVFFRQFAGDVASSAGSVLGAVQGFQQSSADTAREILGPDLAGLGPLLGVEPPAPVPIVAPPEGLDASTAGYRAPFRWDDEVCWIVDQRRLPDRLVDLPLRTAADVVNAINDGALVGSSVQAQVAAVAMAIAARKAGTARTFARRATLRGAATAFRHARPGSAPMAAALDRMLALLESLGVHAEGDEIAAALTAEAERIVAEAIDDHGALVAHVLSALPGAPDEPLHVLLAGSTGAMAGGQFGGAVSAVITAHHAGRPVHALVVEGRPSLEGSRIAVWELRQAGVPHALVTDAAAPGCLAAGEARLVLAGADRIAANGDVIAPAGAYPLALAAAVAGIPFLVCATTNAIDPAVAEGAEADIEEGRPGTVLRVAGTRIAPEGTQVRNPLQDLVPASLVAAIVTEGGVLVPPFAPALATAFAAAAERRRAAPGFAALLAQRAAAAGDGASAPGAGSGRVFDPLPDEGVTAPVDVAALRNPGAGA